MPSVKTAISVPADLFEQMERLSKQLRIPRSRLFARAVEEFIGRRRSAELTAQLDRACAVEDSAEERKFRRHAAGAFRRLLESSR
jgi:metal-responsive CopG/Arc/MetJ family transcriptional regulator